jgi:hypothetical protein
MKLSLIIIITGIILGSAGGFIYWNYWGCLESCPISSNPFISSVYGGVLGGLFGSLVKDYLRK